MLETFYEQCTRIEDGVFRPAPSSTVRVNGEVLQKAQRKGVLPAGFKYIVTKGVQLCIHPGKNTVSVCADDKDAAIVPFDVMDDNALFTVLAWCMLVLHIDTESIVVPEFLRVILPIRERLGSRSAAPSSPVLSWEEKFRKLEAEHKQTLKRVDDLKKERILLANMTKSLMSIKRTTERISELSEYLRANKRKRTTEGVMTAVFGSSATSSALV